MHLSAFSGPWVRPMCKKTRRLMQVPSKYKTGVPRLSLCCSGPTAPEQKVSQSPAHSDSRPSVIYQNFRDKGALPEAQTWEKEPPPSLICLRTPITFHWKSFIQKKKNCTNCSCFESNKGFPFPKPPSLKNSKKGEKQKFMIVMSNVMALGHDMPRSPSYALSPNFHCSARIILRVGGSGATAPSFVVKGNRG